MPLSMGLFLNTSSLNLYTDCQTVNVVETIEQDCLSVLHKLHEHVDGLQLVQVVVQPLVKLLNPTKLDTDRDVNWLMEIIGYGLSMPFTITSEQDSVKDCCTIYCDWLSSALLPSNEQSNDIPGPIRKDPNRYARKMLSHLYNVFLPRHSVSTNPTHSHKEQSDAILTTVSRQAVLCHRVLRTIETIAQNADNLMDEQTWDNLLALLLTVNDKLLSPPTEQDDIGTQLQDRILGVLFELMLIASARSIPSRSLWKTFHELCLNWRHRPALIDHWRRVNLILTKRLVSSQSSSAMQSNITQDSFSNNPPQHNQETTTTNTPSAIESAVSNMSYERLSKTWYRFLTLIGNPVDLSNPIIISKTNEFYRSATSNLDNVLDPRQHPCLNILPHLFLNAMEGVRDMIDVFLGCQSTTTEDKSTNLNTNTENPYIERNIHPRGSIISLTNSIPGSSSSQSQAVTPTQSRKQSAIKAITLKGAKVVSSFPSSTGSHANSTPGTPETSSQMTHEQVSKTGSAIVPNRVQQVQSQFMQPRPSLTSITSRSSLHSQVQCRLQPHLQYKFSPDRPKCNSIMHIFGDWLFSASLIGSELNQSTDDTDEDAACDSSTSLSSVTTPTDTSGRRELFTDLSSSKRASQKTTSSGKQTEQFSRQGELSETVADKMTLDNSLTADSFESGQAEAMAILCKIFSSKTSSEEVSSNYLSRFYLCIQHCLAFGGYQEQYAQRPGTVGPIKRQLLASVLINSTSLLQKDLDGINLLIPSLIKSIEFVLECCDKDTPVQPPPRQHNRPGSIRQSSTTKPITNYDLRRASILTMLNLLAYPYHFENLVIRSCLDDSAPTTTFGSLRPTLLKLLFVAFQTDTDPTNMQILFGGLSSTIHDLAFNAQKTAKQLEDATNKSVDFRRRESRSSTATESTNNSLDGSESRCIGDNTSQSSFVYDSPSGFIVKSLHVTCHLLINIWKHDTQVSLAALELLSTIARVSSLPNIVTTEDSVMSRRSKIAKNNNNYNNLTDMRHEYKQTTKWICDYICNQCSRPPPAHSRDMHSTIVAAYQCLSVWIYSQPHLLEDESCVATLMEVIELGVSGQKSKLVDSGSSLSENPASPQPAVICKSEKVMKPSSIRVRDAAESLLNICMIRSKKFHSDRLMSNYDTVLDEQVIAEIFGGQAYQRHLRQIQDPETRRNEAHKQFKYFSDENLVLYAFYSGHQSYEPGVKDSVVCLMRTPFGKHCWKFKFVYYTEKSREKIIANKTMGLMKTQFQPASTPTPDRIFGQAIGQQNKSLYFNNTAKYFPESLDTIANNSLDQLVTTLDDYYLNSQIKNQRLSVDLDSIEKVFYQQVVAEQKASGESFMQVKKIECEEPQPNNDLEAARIIAAHLGFETGLSSLLSNERSSTSFVSNLKCLDREPVRNRDTVSIFYVRKNRTSAREILESVKERQNVSLSFFEWLLELGEPTVVKHHHRWTGKESDTSANAHPDLESLINDELNSNAARLQLLNSNHGGSVLDGERMIVYWSDLCQELAFLVRHTIEKMAQHPQSSNSNYLEKISSRYATTPSESEYPMNLTGESVPPSPSVETGFHSDSNQRTRSFQDQSQHDQNSDVQSICSLTSEQSSHSTCAPSNSSLAKEASSNSSGRENNLRDNGSASRQSTQLGAARKKRSVPAFGCDTTIIICWLESPDDIGDVPCETLLSVADLGYLLDTTDTPQNPQQQHHLPHRYQHSHNLNALDSNIHHQSSGYGRTRSRDYVKYFISPMKNGLYRINLVTSFGRQWLALPLVDGMTVNKGILSSLIRESVLNLCRRRRLDADSYQPPHVKRRLKILDICNSYKISSRCEPTEFYSNLFRGKTTTTTGQTATTGQLQ